MKGQVLYRPRSCTPTGVIVARAAERANTSRTEVAVRVPDSLGNGIFSAIKPGESAERLAHQADTIDAMRHESFSDSNSIVVYFARGDASSRLVASALNLAQRSKMPVIIQGTHRDGRPVQVVILPRSEANRKTAELVFKRK